jgi:hypothetical protein
MVRFLRLHRKFYIIYIRLEINKFQCNVDTKNLSVELFDTNLQILSSPMIKSKINI